ncbi:type II toxin-antitoxin system HicB family antitoxin [Aestuariivirga sp.]|uniref:type II toxin-antitoxin system HicB family antitoxin n=1 Tax=Aestuariivirga sp. TaxID=2650926 RepID=UPI0039E6FA68
MAVMRYLVLVERDDTGFSVIFPDFPGAGTSGDTVEEALARAEDNLAVHIEGLMAENLAVPEPRALEALKADAELAEDWAADPLVAVIPAVLPEKAERINITIDSGLLRRVDRAAEISGETRSGYVAQALRERLAH